MTNLALDFSPEPGAAARLEIVYQEAFAYWLNERRRNAKKKLSGDSAKMYEDMWGAYTRYCLSRALALQDIDVDELANFLTYGPPPAKDEDQRTASQPRPRPADLSPRYAWRLLRLVDKVLAAVAQRDGLPPNESASELLETEPYRYANANEKDPLPEHLSEAEARLLIGYLSATLLDKPEANESTWREARARIALATMIGAGLAPIDVRSLKVSDVIQAGGAGGEAPWKLQLPGNGRVFARETPLAPWAGRQLVRWLELRAKLAVAGEAWVFPSTPTGGQWSHTGCHMGCKDALRGSGLARDVGLFALRHTFALRQLWRKKDPSDVAHWLGLKDAAALDKYDRILRAPVEVA